MKSNKRSTSLKKDPRVFLGFGQPPLHSSAEWLCGQYRNGKELNLANSLIVLPTSRAVTRLLQLLVNNAKNEKLMFTPPRMVTIGDFPEHLYAVTQPLAPDLCQQLAWSKALQESDPQEIEHLFHGATGKTTFDQWQPYAKLISDLHKRLGNDVWSFSSVVREVLEVDKNFREIERWRALEAIQKRYYKILSDVGFWDKQAARNVAVKRHLCQTDKDVILIGAADLNRATKLMLGQIRPHVRILVAAPRNLSDRFDEFGGLITEQWLSAKVDIDCGQIKIVDTSEDQAFAVSHYISQMRQKGDQFSADQITIGIPDPDVQPQVERSLTAVGLNHRDRKGQPIKNTPPVRLLVAVLDFLDQQTYSTFATLVRHPDMFNWICGKTESSNWLKILDEYQAEGLPDRIELSRTSPFGDPTLASEKYRNIPRIQLRVIEKIKTLNQVHQCIADLFSELTDKPRPIALWTKPWCSVLNSIYGSRVLDKSNYNDLQTIEACREIYLALNDKQFVPDEWELETTSVKALQMAIEAASARNVVSPPMEDAIELSGWLDLPLDDAPVVIVTGMNDEHVPDSENGHLFLPNKLCKDLGIVDNDRRYARDAYALTVIHGVRDHLVLIAGRRDLLGEPKKPSRLLFADDNATIARRANAFFAFEGKSDSRFWLADPETAPKKQQFEIPVPTSVKPLEELSVTSFREFIKCPYRFYLSKVMRLDSLADDWQEMDGRAFGNLAHEVLEDFGRSEVKDATDQKTVLEFLYDCLNTRVKQTYRGSRLPAVKIQIEQLRMRLERFAPLQAEKAREGWRIVSVEENNLHPFDVDGVDFRLSGTIDRIDVHEQTGQVAIWDYKSSDKGDDPRTVHMDRNGWKDLQLPLYRHLAKEIQALDGFDLSNVSLGYVLLPRQLDKVSFKKLHCSQEDLVKADDLAKQIVRKIRRMEYWPPERKAPKFSEAFAGICQDAVFERFDIDTLQRQPEAQV